MRHFGRNINIAASVRHKAQNELNFLSLCVLDNGCCKSASLPYMPPPRSMVQRQGKAVMLDIGFLVLGFVMFGLTIGYAIACDRL
jgi:hypothetical protein